MKKIRLKRKKSAAAQETPHRITNETVAEHRERILAGGRRFKYPVQYARHRLVINTIVISAIALIAVVAVIWQQLYPAQNTSTFFYRITRVLPLPVASIDGQTVPYSNYLLAFRSQQHYLQYKEDVNLYSKENKSYLDRIKRQALDDATADSYAQKIAKEKNITVSNKQIEDALLRQRTSKGSVISEEAYEASALDLYGLSSNEVREETESALLRQEVAYSVDTVAMKQRDQVVEMLKTETDFDKIAAAVPATGDAKVQSSVTPLVPSNNHDGGLAEQAAKLSLNQVSGVFRSTTGDGYYVVKLLQKDNDGRISYASLKIPLTVFEKQLQSVKSSDKTKEYISIPQVKVPTTTQ